ncbi:MAG: class I SAM-dependent methyltransferase [Phycisphaerae bacterium]|nr:class I SAM-dependent methyltransferase [Phycisphaerae bacterium]
MSHVFDPIAGAYDRWYDTTDGQAIFRAEATCLRSLCPRCEGRWLEVGVGTGRFASMLGIAEGVDPSPRMHAIAAGRGIRTGTAYAEKLPFTDGAFDGVLMSLTLCFVADPGQAIGECRRVLRPDGTLLVGTVPADGPWGRHYEAKKAAGHSIYAHAQFLTAHEIGVLIEEAGFERLAAASTLFWGPDGPPETEPRVQAGIVPEAGFLSLLFRKVGAAGRRGTAREEQP